MRCCCVEELSLRRILAEKAGSDFVQNGRGKCKTRCFEAKVKSLRLCISGTCWSREELFAAAWSGMNS